MVEMIVAMSVGIMVAAAAFMLARNSTLFFQNEARIATAQFGAIIGLSRMQAELQRAGYLSSANVQRDPMRCGTMSDWPVGLKELAGIRIEQNGSVTRHPGDHALSALNNLQPDAVIIGGALNSTERFAVRLVAPGAGGLDVFLSIDDGAMQRTLEAQKAGAPGLAAIFAQGRFLRLLDHEGRHVYGVINSFTMVDANTLRISLSATPYVPTRKTYNQCGCTGFCTGTQVSSIARVLYDVRSIDTAQYPQYQSLFTTARHAAPGQHVGFPAEDRTELVRVELDANDAEIDSTLEVVAEHVVDFKLGLSVATQGSTPTLTRYPIGDPQVYAIAQSPSTAAPNQGPQHVRSVQVRLSTRAAERDRDVALPTPAGGGVLRFNLGNNQGFARVRTITADVSLPNQAGVTW